MRLFTFGLTPTVSSPVNAIDRFVECASSEHLRTDYNLGVHLGVLRDQVSYNCQSLVVFIGNREQDLEVRVFLGESRLQVLVQVGFQTFERS
jgi:hypothetical protein